MLLVAFYNSLLINAVLYTYALCLTYLRCTREDREGEFDG